MSTFGNRNNKEYLIHGITIMHLIEQKGTAQDVKKAFEVLVEIRRKLEPLLEFPDNKTDIIYLLLVYGAKTHKACNSDPVYLVTLNPFTLLLKHQWTYVATVHSSSQQAMTQASDQLHTISFCSPLV